jgi:FSR family fosmidomycin resistance protein-like MFS transporter
MSVLIEPPNPKLQESRSRTHGVFGLAALPIGVIFVCHYLIDTYSATLQPLLGVVQTEFGMKPQWAAVLLGLGSIVSGLAQPVFAWASDQLNTRVFGAIGVVLGGIGITLIGFAPNAPVVFLMYAVGMLGIGMFHPIAASTIGQLAGDKRGMAISWFFVFGMGGFFTGSLLAPWLATGSGSLKHLAVMIIPGVLMAVILQSCIGKINHKSVIKPTEAHSMRHYDWQSIWILYLSAVFRFVVNMALVYLLIRWMEQYVAANQPDWTAEQVADFSAPMAGRANATMILGQAVGGLAAGALIVMGKEKWPLVLTPILFSPALASIAFLPPGVAGYVACFFAGVGFAAMTPVAISVGQRLMPYHTSLGSGIMLGGAWAVASVGPRLAEFLIQKFDLQTALITTAVLMACSGLVAIGLRQESLAKRRRIEVNG